MNHTNSSSWMETFQNLYYSSLDLITPLTLEHPVLWIILGTLLSVFGLKGIFTKSGVAGFIGGIILTYGGFLIGTVVFQNKEEVTSKIKESYNSLINRSSEKGENS